MGVDEDLLDGHREAKVYPDGTVIRISIRRTDSRAYPSGWRYTLHYGTVDPDSPGTLSDGTIRRYDNSHEDTKGHELHRGHDPEPERIEFPGIVTIWYRFWDEVPVQAFTLPREE